MVTPKSHTNVARTPVQAASLLVGLLFLIVGLLGFVPSITTNFDAMAFAGHHSETRLLGVFQVSILHNIVHLLFGVAGLLMARTMNLAKWFLIGGGVIYLLLWVYGLLIGKESAANCVPLNTADDWLHFVLGLGMIALGVVLGRRTLGTRHR